MPIYGLKCRKCDHEFERIQAIGEPNVNCPRCGGRTERQIGRTNFKLKGEGWAAQGYSKKDKK